MKTFFVKLNVYVGGYEKSSIHLVNAESSEEAKKIALLGECHGENDDAEFDEDGVYDLGGEFFYEVNFIKEVEPNEEAILKKYLEY